MSPAEPRPRALLFGRNEGAPYHPLAAVQGELVSLLENDFDVRVTDRGESLLALGLGGYELVVGLDDRWTEPLDTRWLAAVESWVRTGGRLLLVHNGICWARDPHWRRLIGGRFVDHGPARELTFTRVDGASFVLWEEPYRFSIAPFTNKRVLVHYEDEGRRWPAAWVRRLGRGRIVFILPGHTVLAFQHPVYRQWLAELSRTKYPEK